MNRAEANMCEQVVTYMLKSGVNPQQIGVITPYEGQRFYSVNLMRRSGSLRAELYDEIEVCVVTQFLLTFFIYCLIRQFLFILF